MKRKGSKSKRSREASELRSLARRTGKDRGKSRKKKNPRFFGKEMTQREARAYAREHNVPFAGWMLTDAEHRKQVAQHKKWRAEIRTRRQELKKKRQQERKGKVLTMPRRNKNAAAAHRHRNPLVTAVVEGIGLAAGLKAFDVASKALSRGKKNPIPLALLQGLEFGAGETAVAEALRGKSRHPTRKTVKKKKQSKKRKGIARRRPQPRKTARKRNPAKKRITHALAVGSPRNIVEMGTRAQVEKTRKLLRKAGVKRRMLIGKRT